MTDNGNATFLTVRDFGPIVRADVELRPITVFVGPSNTGKSFLSMLLYALHRAYGDPQGPAFGRLHGGHTPLRIAKKDRAEAIEWVGRLHESRSRDGTYVLPAEFMALAGRLAKHAYESHLADELVRCFGVVRIEQLIRRSAQKTSVFGTGTTAGIADTLRLRLSSSGQLAETTPTGYTLPEEPFYWPVNAFRATDDPDVVVADVVDVGLGLLRPVVSQAVGPLAHAMYYLPADRTGVMHAYRAIVGSLIHGASRRERAATPNTQELSGVVADFLERIINVPKPNLAKHPPRGRGRTADVGKLIELARSLERGVLEGSVLVDKPELGYPSFSYRPTEWDDDLPLANTSSMVSELAPVVLFLRHVVAPGHTLIVEEPEAHLHPAKQVEFTHHLAAVAKAGVRIVITTHSEWVLEALANLVRMSALPKADRQDLPGGEVALEPAEVGAWMFQPSRRPKGSIVKEIPLDIESATFPAGFGEVTASLYNNWAKISNRVEQGKQQ